MKVPQPKRVGSVERAGVVYEYEGGAGGFVLPGGPRKMTEPRPKVSAFKLSSNWALGRILSFLKEIRGPAEDDLILRTVHNGDAREFYQGKLRYTDW